LIYHVFYWLEKPYVIRLLSAEYEEPFFFVIPAQVGTP